MNAKRCKELRRNLRQQGVDHREVEYFGDNFGLRYYPMPSTRALKPTCGRAVYKAAKKAGAV